VANSISEIVDDCLVIVESKPHDSIEFESTANPTLIQSHFYERYKTESKFFKGNDFFRGKTIPMMYQEANLSYAKDAIQKFQPDAIFVFGSSILKNDILDLVQPGKIVNMHLGLSPYYRGSGTNFWPFVNDELEYVGATILHIDPGVDTGDIITHVQPNFEVNDNVHTIGCKVIKKGTKTLIQILDSLKKGNTIIRVKQWKIPNEKYYRMKDFDEESLKIYKKNLEDKIIEKYLNSPKKKIDLVSTTF
jgi:methionyl-tRNA formyltransferase